MPHDVPPTGRRSFKVLMIGLAALSVFVIAHQVMRVINARLGVVGDRHTLESYRFDLSNLQVDRATLVPGGLPRDGQPVVFDPRSVTMQEVAKLNANPRRQFIAGADAVVGVVIAGQARAYPVRFLFWHEIVNDELGGVPIAVTFSPLCDSVVVFDRRVEGRVMRFGYSGLLSNSNLVMYDRQERESDQSLWSQLRFRAIAGPLAGRPLDVLPMWHGKWSEWAASHADTTVWAGEAAMKDQYKGGGIFGVGSHPLRSYFDKGELRYPVQPVPPGDGGRRWMDRVLIERRDGRWSLVDSPTGDLPTVRACWFAWFAMHGAP